MPIGIDAYEWESYFKIKIAQSYDNDYKDHYAVQVHDMCNIPIEFKEHLFESPWKMAICKKIVLDGRRALIHSADPVISIEFPKIINIKRILENHNMFINSDNILFECRVSVNASNLLRVLYCRDRLNLPDLRVGILNILEGKLYYYS